MSQRSTSPLSRSTVRRTLQRFWDVTRTQPLIVFLSVLSSAGYIFLLTFANTYSDGPYCRPRSSRSRGGRPGV